MRAAHCWSLGCHACCIDSGKLNERNCWRMTLGWNSGLGSIAICYTAFGPSDACREFVSADMMVLYKKTWVFVSNQAWGEKLAIFFLFQNVKFQQKMLLFVKPRDRPCKQALVTL
jgi:hypothetical protein